jgi:hypothetical protein
MPIHRDRKVGCDPRSTGASVPCLLSAGPDRDIRPTARPARWIVESTLNGRLDGGPGIGSQTGCQIGNGTIAHLRLSRPLACSPIKASIQARERHAGMGHTDVAGGSTRQGHDRAVAPATPSAVTIRTDKTSLSRARDGFDVAAVCADARRDANPETPFCTLALRERQNRLRLLRLSRRHRSAPCH